jgi:thiosulfate/3-mercaptopyruvate sulfurtransferase
MKREIHVRSLTVLAVALVFVTACGGSPPTDQPGIAESVNQPIELPDTLVTAQWLAENLDEPDLVVLDCNVRVEMDEETGLRVVNGRADYDAGHIPGAGFADLMGELADSESEFKYALPTPEAFAAAMGALGVGDDSRVVLYDARGLGWSARVWWMLRWIGFDRAALLDGGLESWKAAGLPLSTEPADRPAGRLTLDHRPELIADRDEVLAAANEGGVCLVDAMPEAHFRGEMAMYARPGHIPGAVNIPSMTLLDETGHYRPSDELVALHDCDPAVRAITYCGGGIAASANAFVMTRLGYGDVAVYTASLQEWAADPANPMVTEAAP